MDTLEKSKALAKLMGWGLGKARNGTIMIANDYPVIGRESWIALRPYDTDMEGLAQFAAILLKFPKAIMHYTYDRDKAKWLDAEDGELFKGVPTQASILDVILNLSRVGKS